MESLLLAGLWTSLLDVGIAVLALLSIVNAWAPPQDLPWKPLALDAPLGLATPMKFAHAAADPTLCRQVLRQGGVGFREAPVSHHKFCETANALRLTSGVTALSPAEPVMTCPMALGYAFWDRHVLQPAAREELGSPAVSITHYGTYACRYIFGRANRWPSEHARANAIDVAGVRLADGRQVTVLGDFVEDSPRGRFIRDARNGACSWFSAVLGPDFNRAHRDHLHLDFGGHRICS